LAAQKAPAGRLDVINVRDRRGLVQVVIDNKTKSKKLRGLQIGTVLAVDGNVVGKRALHGGADCTTPN